jgi:hypothetical protein
MSLSSPPHSKRVDWEGANLCWGKGRTLSRAEFAPPTPHADTATAFGPF